VRVDPGRGRSGRRRGERASAPALFGLQAPPDPAEDSLAVEEEAELVAAGLAVGVVEGPDVDREEDEGAPPVLGAPPGVELSVELPAHQVRRSQSLEDLGLGAPADLEPVRLRDADSDLGVAEGATAEQPESDDRCDALHRSSSCTPSPTRAAPLWRVSPTPRLTLSPCIIPSESKNTISVSSLPEVSLSK
jgi:hypothetical protein